MAQYDSYKDSGVKWLGLIPSHWEMKRWRFLMSENTEKNLDCKERLQLQFRYGDIVRKSNQSDEKEVLNTISKYTVVEPDDIMINGLNLNYDFISQRVGQVREKGVITSAYVSLRPTTIANSRYYTYFLKPMDSKKMFHGMGTGVRLTLSYNELKNKFIPYPSIEEQNAIATYLDTATAKIDKAIAQQQKMIDLLNERKQIIINSAVSKGINPNTNNTALKPKDWIVVPLKVLISFVNGFAFNSNEFKNEGEIGVIRISNISDSNVTYKEMVFVDKRDILNSFETKKGDLLIAMSGATTGKVGFDLKGGLYINQRVGLIRSNNQKWIFYWLNTTYFKDYIAAFALGSAQPNISSDDIKNFRVLYPQNDDTVEIVNNIDAICLKFDKLIELCNNQITLLQERKQIIINDVVTGKVKVY